MNDQPLWYAGIDWGGTTHQACVIDADGNELGNRSFKHSGSGLAAMAWAQMARLSSSSRTRESWGPKRGS